MGFLERVQRTLASIKVANSQTTLPCVHGFIMNINSLIGLFDELSQTYGFKFILTNRLNQDPLENHFAIIRNCACFLYISLFYVCLSCIVFRVSTFVVNKHLHYKRSGWFQRQPKPRSFQGLISPGSCVTFATSAQKHKLCR